MGSWEQNYIIQLIIYLLLNQSIVAHAPHAYFEVPLQNVPRPTAEKPLMMYLW